MKAFCLLILLFGPTFAPTPGEPNCRQNAIVRTTVSSSTNNPRTSSATLGQPKATSAHPGEPDCLANAIVRSLVVSSSTNNPTTSTATVRQANATATQSSPTTTISTHQTTTSTKPTISDEKNTTLTTSELASDTVVNFTATSISIPTLTSTTVTKTTSEISSSISSSGKTIATAVSSTAGTSPPDTTPMTSSTPATAETTSSERMTTSKSPTTTVGRTTSKTTITSTSTARLTNSTPKLTPPEVKPTTSTTLPSTPTTLSVPSTKISTTADVTTGVAYEIPTRTETSPRFVSVPTTVSETTATKQTNVKTTANSKVTEATSGVEVSPTTSPTDQLSATTTVGSTSTAVPTTTRLPIRSTARYSDVRKVPTTPVRTVRTTPRLSDFVKPKSTAATSTVESKASSVPKVPATETTSSDMVLTTVASSKTNWPLSPVKYPSTTSANTENHLTTSLLLTILSRASSRSGLTTTEAAVTTVKMADTDRTTTRHISTSSGNSETSYENVPTTFMKTTSQTASVTLVKITTTEENLDTTETGESSFSDATIATRSGKRTTLVKQPTTTRTAGVPIVSGSLMPKSPKTTTNGRSSETTTEKDESSSTTDFTTMVTRGEIVNSNTQEFITTGHTEREHAELPPSTITTKLDGTPTSLKNSPTAEPHSTTRETAERAQTPKSLDSTAPTAPIEERYVKTASTSGTEDLRTDGMNEETTVQATTDEVNARSTVNTQTDGTARIHHGTLTLSPSPEPTVSKAKLTTEMRAKETATTNENTETELSELTTNVALEVVETTTSREKDATVTDDTTPSVVHFFDIAVEEPTTPVPKYCSNVCPEGWTEGEKYCFLIPPPEKSISYSKAISYCQMLVPHLSNLASSYEFQDLENLDLFKEMLSNLTRKSDWFFINMLASKKFRSSLKADIVSLAAVNRVDLHVVDNVGSIEKVDNVSAVCRTTRFCTPNKCGFEQFLDYDKDLVVRVPAEKELAAGETVILPCIEFGPTGQEHIVRCQMIGEFGLHPSMITCKKPVDYEDDEPDTSLNPKFPWACSQCYDAGTKMCVENDDGPGIVCRCHDGWSMRTCWKSPNFCVNNTCGPNGECLSLGDRYECICAPGMIGSHCEINATRITMLGSNGTVSFVNLRTLGVAAQLSSNMAILVIKFLAKFIKAGESDDPQETFILYRLSVHSIANMATFFYGHPDLLKVDAISCRWYFWVISAAYSCGLMLYVNEGSNIMEVTRSVHTNKWTFDIEGKPRKYMRFIARVTIPMFGTIFAILAILTHGWEESTSAYTCFGKFKSTTVDAWFPLLLLNGALVILCLSTIEAAWLLRRFRPHTTIRLHNWYELNAPARREEIGKVERNLKLVPVGVILHFLCWGSLTFANDRDTTFANSITFVLCSLYSLFNVLQMIVTEPNIYGWVSIKAMRCLPKRFSPDFEWNNLRTRDEVLQMENKERYNKEQDQLIREEDQRRAKEIEEIEEKNRELLKKYPGLPKRLQYHIPEEGPAISYPRPFPFPPTNKDFLTSFERTYLARFWTRSYLEARAFHKGTPEYCAWTVIKHEIKRNIFRQKSEERRKQELFALAMWWNSVPAMDRTELVAHQNTVIMEDPFETPLLAFDRAVLKLASIIDLRANRERRKLLDDPSIADFENAAKFLKFEPRKPIKCVMFQAVDGLGDVVDREFIKVPDMCLESQVAKFDKYYFRGVKELNEKFYQMFDDDQIFTQWSNTGFKKAAHSILKVQRSRIGRQRTPVNPRKRPLDSFWLDSDRPDFVGPREEPDGRIPVGQYERTARRLQYYQQLTDAQWSQIAHNAYHMENLKKIRKGQL